MVVGPPEVAPEGPRPGMGAPTWSSVTRDCLAPTWGWTRSLPGGPLGSWMKS